MAFLGERQHAEYEFPAVIRRQFPSKSLCDGHPNKGNPILLRERDIDYDLLPELLDR